MTVHKHRLVLAGEWFTCERCTARVEVVPLFEPSDDGVKVTASLRVRDAGRAAFTVDELSRLARFWLGHFRIYMERREKRKQRGKPSSRRSVSMSAPQLVGVWADPSGVDHSTS